MCSMNGRRIHRIFNRSNGHSFPNFFDGCGRVGSLMMMKTRKKYWLPLLHWILKYFLVVLPAGYVFFLNCASSGPHRSLSPERATFAERPFICPPGVDSTLAKEAHVKAGSLFVSIEDEELANQKADDGRRMFEIFRDIESLISLQDSLKDRDFFLTRLQALSRPMVLKDSLRRMAETRGLSFTFQRMAQENRERLDRIRDVYESAYALNRFDTGLMVDLAHIYRLTAEALSGERDVSEYDAQAKALLKNALVMDRSDHRIYSRLGEYYMASQDWEQAREYTIKAYDVLRDFEFLPPDFQEGFSEAVEDSSTLFRYLTGVIHSSIKLRDSQTALHYIQKADVFGRTESDKRLLSEYRELIDWASGDILAREMFVQAENLRDEGNFLQAAHTYHGVLRLTRDKAEEAYWETAYKLSLMEYTYLRDHPEYLKEFPSEQVGIGRLRSVILDIPKDAFGAPRDGTYIDYFDNYGTMLFNQGIEAVNHEERHFALAYFLQGALLHSKVQARCCLELVKLTMHRGSVGSKWALKTYSLKDHLLPDEIAQLYQLLRFVMKRSNNPVLCRYFNDEYRSYAANEPFSGDPEIQIMAYEFLRSGFKGLDTYLQNHFHIRQDSVLAQLYGQKYHTGESHLPVERREVLRQKITEMYQKMGEGAYLDDWLESIRRLR